MVKDIELEIDKEILHASVLDLDMNIPTPCRPRCIGTILE